TCCTANDVHPSRLFPVLLGAIVLESASCTSKHRNMLPFLIYDRWQKHLTRSFANFIPIYPTTYAD
ncbi:tudor domain-containing protein 1, partial [Moniliophthora roreri]